MILGGVDRRQVQRRSRYQRPAATAS